MSLEFLRLDSFRCLEAAELAADPDLNVIIGGNGAGKTSLLEAIYVLGRARSFRAPRLASLIADDRDSATLYAETGPAGHRLGVRIGRSSTEIHVDGSGGATAADLAAALAVQLIDPSVQELVQGGPGQRRRFLDWGVFHVKHEFLAGWRRFRRALQQRNAALRQGAAGAAVAAWDADLLAGAATVNRCRNDYVAEIAPILQRYAAKFLESELTLVYRPGWPDGATLAETLAAGMERDRSYGATQHGPHRAELEILVGDQPARNRLSRGQHKLLGAALVLGQSDWVHRTSGKRPVLLVDEPAAELDAEHLAALTEGVRESGAQVFITALQAGALPLDGNLQQFHVERGQLSVLV